MKKILKAIFLGAVGSNLLALYFRFVYATSRVSRVPATDPDYFGKSDPLIYATWHGQSYIFAFRFKRGCHPTLMSAKHRDGRMIGNAMRLLGFPLIHGSGTTKKDGPKKGGAVAFLRLLRLLRQGRSITITADVPKITRKVGEGIVLLARKSGAPIVPVGMASSRRRQINSWDKMAFNLPFSHIVYVRGDPVSVPNDDTPLAIYQTQLHAALEKADQQALDLADGIKT